MNQYDKVLRVVPETQYTYNTISNFKLFSDIPF